MVQAFQISSLNFDIATGITPLGAVHIVSLSADGRMMAVEVKARPEFGIPKPLFDVHSAAGFDVAKDGRFLIALPVEQKRRGLSPSYSTGPPL